MLLSPPFCIAMFSIAVVAIGLTIRYGSWPLPGALLVSIWMFVALSQVYFLAQNWR